MPRPAATERDPATFASGLLSDVACGTIELSVPLRSDVIQIGAGGEVDVGRIRISTDRESVTVRRVDGRPIQVNVVGDRPGMQRPDVAAASRVFDAPVDEVRWVRLPHEAGPSRWRLAGATGHTGRVKQFADVVGTFAVARQRRLREISTRTAGGASIAG